MSRSSISTSSLSDTDSFPSTPTTPTTQFTLPLSSGCSPTVITITIINPTPYSLQAIKNNHGWNHLQDPICPNSDGTLILHSPNTGKAAYILGDTGDVIEVAGGIGMGDHPMVKLCPELGGGDNEVLECVMKEPGHFVYRLPEMEHMDHAHAMVEMEGLSTDLMVNNFTPCF
ncbi:hypothetical protein TWF173_005519 [Orbilia oligospora]|uniref:Uncharacterized protein n=1 Tax=Orbilia oligospora TaxID=2813651 RepID=A0A7C8RJW6_ORBOL|nr:hypothetical protein TWF970_007126 [Orbilia oligospora]KAF3313926.1 hypothetical protein TWF173_005519 [Orbilia oligospora]